MKNNRAFMGTINRCVVESKKIKTNSRIRTLTISDIHGYTNNKNKTISLVNAIRLEKLDIIFIAGDIFNRSKNWFSKIKVNRFRNFINNISNIAPVCITLGNNG